MKKIMLSLGLLPLAIASCGHESNQVKRTAYYWGSYNDEVVKVDFTISSNDFRTATVKDIKFDRTFLAHKIEETGVEISAGLEVNKEVAEAQYARKMEVYKVKAPSDKGVCITKNYPVDLNEPLRSNHLLLLATEGEEINHVGINDISVTISEATCSTLGFKSKWVAAGQEKETIIEKDKNVANGPLGMKAIKDIYTDSYLPLNFDFTQASLQPSSNITFERVEEIHNSKRATIGRDFEDKIVSSAQTTSWIDSINAIENVFIGERISKILANNYYSSAAFETPSGTNPVNITGSTLGTTTNYAKIVQAYLRKIK